MNYFNLICKFLVLSVLLCAVAAVALGQDDAQPLLPNQTIEREMTGAETHRYKFELKKDEFFQVQVEQKGVDVALKLLDSDGKTLATMDSPNGKEGPETLSFVADKAGNFVLEVSGFDPKAEKGNYTIFRIPSRTATTVDKKRVEVEKVFVEGMTARENQDKENESSAKLTEALKGWQELKEVYLENLTTFVLKQIKVNKIYREAVILLKQQSSESLQMSVERFLIAAKQYEEIGETEGKANSLFNVGFILSEVGNKQVALEYYSKALIDFRGISNKSSEARTLSGIGLIFFELGDLQKALENLNEALRITRSIQDFYQESTALNNIGMVFYRQGYLDKALDYYIQALSGIRKSGDNRSEARLLNNIGLIYSTLGNKEKSLEFYNKSLPLSRFIADKSGEATTIGNIGAVYQVFGESIKALEFYNQALLLLRQLGNKQEEATTLNNIGEVLSQLGEKEKALDYYNQALSLSKLVGNKDGEATALNNIGSIYQDLGEKLKGLEYFQQAFVLFRNIGNRKGEASTSNNIGQIYSELNQSQNALDYFYQSLEFSKQIGDKSLQAVTLNNISLIYLSIGKYQEAIENFNQALTIFRQVNDKLGEAATLNNVGFLYFSTGDNDKAIKSFNLALTIRRDIGDKSGESHTLNNLMWSWNNLKNTKLAIFYGKQSVNGFQQLRSNIKGLDKVVQKSYSNSISSTYRYLANILISESRLTEAQAVLDLLKEEEFSKVVQRGGEVSETIPYSKAEESSIKILDQLASLGREKGELTEKNEKGSLTEAERQRFKDLEKQIELTEAEFNKSLTALSAETNKTENFDVVVKDAQAFMSTLKELGSGTVALYTVIVNDSKPEISPNPNQKEQIKTGWIILVTPEFRKAYPVDVKDLEQTIFNFRQTLTSPTYNPLPFAQELYKKMFLQTSDKQKTTLAADLEEYFKDKPNKTLMWSLDGIFRYVPIAALHDGKQYLVERYRNTIFNTASKDRLKDAVKQNWTALGLGVSQGRTESGKTFVPLAGAKRELLKIVKQDNNQAIFSGKIKMDEQFTPDAMFDSLSFDKNPLVHIASHFSYQIADFDSSFLLLGQGKLTVRDLRVKSQLFNGVDLLTLSACETAVPDANGKDVEGFAYLAQSLGAKAVMATLWQVDDIGTQIMMPEFYRLRETKLYKAEALRQAQLALLQGKIKDLPADVKRAEIVGNTNNQTKLEKYDPTGKPPYAHPYYWSPFVLIGNWK